jgi:hypothetical protein
MYDTIWLSYLCLYPPTNDRSTIIRQSRPKKAIDVDSTNSMHHLNLPSTLLALALPLLSQYALPTLANTEIINFEAGKPVHVAPLSENW